MAPKGGIFHDEKAGYLLNHKLHIKMQSKGIVFQPVVGVCTLYIYVGPWESKICILFLLKVT